MRVLWFCNVPTLEMYRHAGQVNVRHGGHWVAQLSRHLLGTKDIELGIAVAYPDLPESEFEYENVHYFIVQQPHRFHAFDMRTADIKKCLAIIEKFQPDIIHIHGSERFYGMIRASGKTTIPTCLSIQGLLGSFSLARHFFGSLSLRDIFRSLRLIELPFRLGLAWQFLYARKGARREAKILAGVDGFLGRTEWDRAHVKQYHQAALYFPVGEILRPVFYESRWDLTKCDRHTVIYTNAGHPNRGTENLLAAIAFLRTEFPAIRLRLAGIVSARSGYGRFIRRRIRDLKLDDRVDFLGYLDDQAMVCELLRTHVFAITSYNENSPNSLAEAMLVGMPCVASYVGGIPSMVRDNETGLLYPVDDVPLLAEKIRQIFVDGELANRLASNARDAAHQRHEPARVVGQLTAAYRGLLASRSQ